MHGKIIQKALPLVPALLLAGYTTGNATLPPGFWKGEIPDALIASDGTKIDSADAWMSKRRPELLQLFSTVVYGNPLPAPEGIEFKLLERSDNALGGKAIRIQGDITCKGVGQPNAFRLLLYLPKNAEGPAPVFLGLNFMGNQSISSDPEILIPEWNAKPRPRGARTPRYDLEKIIGAGYGIATIHNADIEPDRPDAWRTGVRNSFLTDGVQRTDDPAAISTWAWGLSRGLDALLTIPEVDPNRVIVWGHSRLGKTSLWAAATDPRFAAAISNDSGCGGASLTRHILKDEKSETLQRIIKTFPHWFALNLNNYVGREETLPVDQHELIALVAPRPVYIASAEEDVWADPEGEFLAAREASKVYRLFGFEGIAEDTPMPRLHTPVGKQVGYHIRTGKHDVQSFDWAAFIDFMNANLPAKRK
ncbi:MAG: acetylxylan esterase [Lentisphaeria bacterium]|nr:acetylxylan esterase [Lentisphaeria bacterium]